MFRSKFFLIFVIFVDINCQFKKNVKHRIEFSRSMTNFEIELRKILKYSYKTKIQFVNKRDE